MNARRPERLGLVVVIALVLLQATFVFDHDAWTPDEPRVQELCRSVYLGSCVVPYLGGEPFLEQPPLHEWSVAPSFRLLGVSSESARLVSALSGLVACAVTFLIAERLATRRAGFLAAAALGTTFGFWFTTHRIVCDGLLAALVAGSGYASLRALTATGRERRLALALAYALASLAFLTKNVVGLALAGLGFLAVVLALRSPGLLRAHLWLAPLIFAVVCGSYLAQLHREVGTPGLRELVWSNTVGRAVAGASHAQPSWYYLLHFPLNAMPSGLLAVPALVDFARNRRRATVRERFAIEFPLFWILLGVAGLSCASGKRELYVVPLYPALAVLSGVWLDRALALGDARSASAWLATHLPVVLAGVVGAAGVVIAVAAAVVLEHPHPVVTIIPVSALMGLATTFRARRRGASELAWGSALLGFTGTLAATLALIVPEIDREKRLGPTLASIGAAIPEGVPVYVLEPDETLRGAIPFYAGRVADPILRPDRSPEARATFHARLAAQGTLYLIAFEKHASDDNLHSLREFRPVIVYEDVRRLGRTVRLLNVKAS